MTTRPCARPDCERSTAWPRDPELIAAFCRDHTDELLAGPREPEPEWVRRVRDGRTSLVRDFTRIGSAR